MSRMRVYVAGPYRGKIDYDVEVHIINAWLAASLLIKDSGEKINPFVPHMNTRRMGGIASDEYFLESDLDWLGFCDAMLVLAGSEDSSGVQGEIEFATKYDIPIYFEEYGYEKLIEDAKNWSKKRYVPKLLSDDLIADITDRYGDNPIVMALLGHNDINNATLASYETRLNWTGVKGR